MAPIEVMRPLSNQESLLNQAIRQVVADEKTGQFDVSKGVSLVHGSGAGIRFLDCYAGMTGVETEDCFEYAMLAELVAMSIEIGRRLERRIEPLGPPNHAVDIFFHFNTGRWPNAEGLVQ